MLHSCRQETARSSTTFGTSSLLRAPWASRPEGIEVASERTLGAERAKMVMPPMPRIRARWHLQGSDRRGSPFLSLLLQALRVQGLSPRGPPSPFCPDPSTAGPSQKLPEPESEVLSCPPTRPPRSKGAIGSGRQEGLEVAMVFPSRSCPPCCVPQHPYPHVAHPAP